MSMNKANGYSETLSPYSYSISGISKIQSDLGAENVTVTQTDGRPVSLYFTYGDDVVTGYTQGSDGSASIFGGVRITYPAGSRITASDWEPVFAEGEVRLTTTVLEYLEGQCLQNGVRYERQSAPLQQSFKLQFSCGGDETELIDTRLYIEQEYDGSVLIYIPDSEAGFYGAAYFENLEWDYNRLYTSTKSFRCVVEGQNDTTGNAGSCRMVWATTVDNPSFLKASLLENRWGSSTVVSGNNVRFTAKNPLKLAYSGQGQTAAGNLVIDTSISQTKDEETGEINSTDYHTLTPSPLSDWLATKTGYNMWAESYDARMVVTYSFPIVVPDYAQNTYIIEPQCVTTGLTIKCSETTITDFSAATIYHNTPSTVASLEDLWIDNGKTNIAVNLQGTRIPRYPLNGSTELFFELILQSGNYTQYKTGLSTTFATIINNSTIDGDYYVLDSNNIFRFSDVTNLNLPYAETPSDLTVKLSVRWFYNNANYARGIRTDTGDVIYPYRVPQISEFDGYRYKSSGSSSYAIDETNGTIAGIYSVFSLTPLGNVNVFTVHNIKAARTDTPDSPLWQNKDLNSGIRLYISTPSMDTNYSYVVTLTLTDCLYTTVTSTITIAAGRCFLDFKAGGDGMAIGKASEKNGLEVNFDADFYGNVTYGTAATPVDLDVTNANIVGLQDITIPGTATVEGTLDVTNADVVGLTLNEGYALYAPIGNGIMINALTNLSEPDTAFFTLNGQLVLSFSSYLDTTGHSRASYTGTIDLSALASTMSLLVPNALYGIVNPIPAVGQNLLSGGVFPNMYRSQFSWSNNTNTLTVRVDFYVDPTRTSSSTVWTTNWSTVPCFYSIGGLRAKVKS